jgi:hypothetical protein
MLPADEPRRSILPPLLTLLGVLMAIAVVTTAPLWMLGCDCCEGRGNASEAQLVAWFDRHAPACERLRVLCREKPGLLDKDAWLRPEPYAEEYERLCGEIGAIHVWADHVGDCELAVGFAGNRFRGRTCSFVFCPSGSAPPDRPPRPDTVSSDRYVPLRDR